MFALILFLLAHFAVIHSQEAAENQEQSITECWRFLDYQLFKEGISCFEKKLPENDREERIYEALGFANLKLGFYAKACEFFQLELNQYPRNRLSGFLSGIALMLTGETEKAAVLISPFCSGAAGGGTRKSDRERKFTEDNPGLPDFVMGLIRFREQEWNKAKICFERAMEEGYSETDCLFLLLRLAGERSGADETEKIYSRLLELDPEKLEAPASWYSGDFISPVDEILRERPLLIRYLLDSLQKTILFMDSSAKTAVNDGRVNQALQIWRRALSIAPDDFMLNYNYSLMLTLSNPQKSLESLRHCLRALRRNDPEHLPDALNLTGNIYFGMKRYEDAVTCYSRSITIDPGHITAHSNLAAAWKTLGDTVSAEREWLWVISHVHVHENEESTRESISDEKIEILVDVREIGLFIEACESLAELYSRQSNEEMAVLFWKRILSVSPERGDVHFHLGEYYLNHNEREKAQTHFEKASLYGTLFQKETDSYLQRMRGKKN